MVKCQEIRKFIIGRKSGLVVSKLDSRLEGRGFESHLMLDGNGVKAMPGSIPASNWFIQQFKRKKIKVGK